MVSTKFMTVAFLVQETLVGLSVPGVQFIAIPLPSLEELPGDAYEADVKLYKIYSMILLQRQTTISAAHVSQVHTWACLQDPPWGEQSTA